MTTRKQQTLASKINLKGLPYFFTFVRDFLCLERNFSTRLNWSRIKSFSNLLSLTHKIC